jgi:hypothetical protein
MLTKDQLANVVRSGNSRFPSIGRLSIFNTEMTAHSAQPDRSPGLSAAPSGLSIRPTASSHRGDLGIRLLVTRARGGKAVRAGANEGACRSSAKERQTRRDSFARHFSTRPIQLSGLVALSLEGGALQPRRRPISSPRWRSLRPATVLAELIWHCASRRATRAGPYAGRASRSACTFWLRTHSGGVARMSVIRTLPVASSLLSRARPMRISFALRNASSR